MPHNRHAFAAKHCLAYHQTIEAHRLVEGVSARELPQVVLCLVVYQADGAGLIFHVLHFAVFHCSSREGGRGHGVDSPPAVRTENDLPSCRKVSQLTRSVHLVLALGPQRLASSRWSVGNVSAVDANTKHTNRTHTHTGSSDHISKELEQLHVG